MYLKFMKHSLENIGQSEIKSDVFCREKIEFK